MDEFVYMYLLSFLLIILGFIALLAQKVYIDSEMNPTEIELPILGKLKTNYPALGFVIFGCALAIFTFNEEPKLNIWNITGTLEGIRNEEWDPNNLQVKIHPSSFDHPIIRKNGDKATFEINGSIEEGKSFEDVVEFIDFSHPDFSQHFIPKNEYQIFEDNPDSSRIESVTESSRYYKPLSVNNF